MPKGVPSWAFILQKITDLHLQVQFTSTLDMEVKLWQILQLCHYIHTMGRITPLSSSYTIITKVRVSLDLEMQWQPPYFSHDRVTLKLIRRVRFHCITINLLYIKTLTMFYLSAVNERSFVFAAEEAHRSR